MENRIFLMKLLSNVEKTFFYMSSLLISRLQHSNRLCWGGDRTSDPFPSISGFFISGFFTILHCQRSTISSSFKSFFSENLKTKTLNWIWMSDWLIDSNQKSGFYAWKKRSFIIYFFYYSSFFLKVFLRQNESSLTLVVQRLEGH